MRRIFLKLYERNNKEILPGKGVLEEPHRKFMKSPQKTKKTFVVGCIKRKKVVEDKELLQDYQKIADGLNNFLKNAV